jgi:aminotransferase
LPSDIAAAIGLAQLERLDALQARRRAVWDRYQEAFSEVEWITTPVGPGPGERHSYFTYFIQVPHRDRLARHLLERGIYTTLRFHPLHLNRFYGSQGRLPVAETLSETGLNLPLHPRLSDDEVSLIVDTVVAARP